jgi:para-nitrobenzyl esterase
MILKRVAIVGMCLAVFACSRAEREHGTAPDTTTQRLTSSGPIVGFVGSYGSHVWLGIPYAKAPVGELRWRVAQSPDPWKTARPALTFGSPCLQYGSALGGTSGSRPDEPTGSEDCLYLNVYAPPSDGKRAAALPVMVWIHGGGNTIGEAGFYNGGNLAMTHQVVVVTVNYRLGPFGWLRHASLRNGAETPEEQSGNFGTLDLVHALHWVRDNASVFGGDPTNVTIFGESAGGANVYTMLLSPQARGLFARAIVQSGSVRTTPSAWAENFEDDVEPGDGNSSNEMIVRALIADGRAQDRAAAKRVLAQMSMAEVATYLRGRSAVDVLRSYPPNRGAGMIRMPLVFADGTVLQATTPSFASTQTYNRVPVMVGTNRDENKLFMVTDPEYVRRILWIFPRLRDERMYQLTAEYLAKMWKAIGVDEPATAMRAAQGASVYAYRFDWDEEPTILGADLSVMAGAAHVFEIPFVFGHFDLGRLGNLMFTTENEPGRLTLSKQMMSYWAEFAYRGAPSRGRGGELPEWTAWDNDVPTSPKFMVLDTAAGGGLRMSNETVTAAGVIAAIDDDERLPTQRDKCTIYRALAKESRGFTKEKYATLGCAAYPLEAYPWPG